MPTEVAPAGRGHPFPEFRSSPAVRVLNRGPDYLRRQMEGGGSGRMSAVERLAADRLKYVKSPQVAGTAGGTLSSASGSSSGGCSAQSGALDVGAQNENQEPGSTGETSIPRRSSSKRQTRPDSLLIYRQKPKGEGGKDPSRGGFVRRLFQGSGKDKGTSPDAPKIITHREGSEAAARAPCSDPRLEAPAKSALLPPDSPRRGAGVHRSQSDISSRYSKSFSEFDTFFRYCGLEPEVIEALGRERFSAELPAARVRSVSMATSDSGFSRHSGEQGLQEDELHGQPHSGPSVIERNARIIKWLYGCRAAREDRGARELV